MRNAGGTVGETARDTVLESAGRRATTPIIPCGPFGCLRADSKDFATPRGALSRR